MAFPLIPLTVIAKAIAKAAKAVPPSVWLVLAFLAAVAGSLWYANHSGKMEERAKTRQQIEQLRAELGKCAAIVKRQTDENVKAIANAEKAKANAEAAERRAGLYADRFASQMVSIERSLTKAKLDPTCKAVLERTSCAPFQ